LFGPSAAIAIPAQNKTNKETGFTIRETSVQTSISLSVKGGPFQGEILR
jgi:hypothetical protein